MKTLTRKLALAAAVAALAPAAARACEQPSRVARVAVEAPAPTVIMKVDARWGDDDRRDREWREDHDGWRREEPGRYAWRARERAELRAELARLEDTRARFYAVPHRPWRVRQFEAWYAHEHAELDARWARVS